MSENPFTIDQVTGSSPQFIFRGPGLWVNCYPDMMMHGEDVKEWRWQAERWRVLLARAYEAGKEAKASEVRAVLGI